MTHSEGKKTSGASGGNLFIHILSHTHWDFEWYEIEEGFKLQLVRFMDHLLKTLEKDPEFKFHFDGQVMPIVDYLEVLKERDDLDEQDRVGEAEEKIRRFVQRGQLFVGPCWTTMETSVISMESLIRNINRGRRFSKKMGGVCPIFYNADAFQYHSQVPQIVRGTALNAAFTWRGYKENAPLKDVTRWQGADKTAILKYHPARTYAQVWHLPDDPEKAAEIIVHEARQLKHFAVSRHILITQGNDQFEAQPELNDLIARVNNVLGKKFKVDQVALDDFFVMAKRQRLNVIRGELTDNKWAATMSGQLSARIYLKQKNESAEIFIEKWAEPFATFNWLTGGEYQAGLIERAWEYLMKQHFHHCNACAVDAVHREGEVRYNNAIELARDITDESLANIAAQVNTAGMIHKWENALVVFNPTGTPVDGVVTVSVQSGKISTNAEWQTSLPGSDAAIAPLPNLVLWDASENRIPFQVLGADAGRIALAIRPATLPPFGFSTFGLDVAGDGTAGQEPPLADEKKAVMENDLIKVDVHENGTFSITDKRNKAVYRHLNLIEDAADHGDTYNYDPLKGDRPVTARNVKGRISFPVNGPLMATAAVRLELAVPAGLAPDRRTRSKKHVKMPVAIHVSMTAGSPRVWVRTVVDNTARDHRLRALFPAVKADAVYVQTQADVVKRPLGRVPPHGLGRKRLISHRTSIGELPMEAGPSPTKFQRNFIGLNNGREGLVVFNKGLPEYEASPDGVLALTLMRCVGWISQDDLGTRKNLAGPKIAVPEAQCPGEQTFEYAVMPQAGAWDATPVYHLKNLYSAGIKAVQVPRQQGPLPTSQSFVRLFPPALMVSCIKKAYKDGHVIVRFYNPTARKQKGRLEVFSGIASAWEANMNEKRLKKIPVGPDGILKFDVSPKKIMTVAVWPKSGV